MTGRVDELGCGTLSASLLVTSLRCATSCCCYLCPFSPLFSVLSTDEEELGDTEGELMSEDLGSDEEFVLGSKKKSRTSRTHRRGTRARRRVRKLAYSSDEEFTGRYGQPVRMTGRHKGTVK